MPVQPPVTAYITVKGGLEAIELYKRAFGAVLFTHEMAEDGERVMHAALGVFGTMIMLSDEFPDYDPDMKAPTTIGGTTFMLHVDCETPAKVDERIAKAEAAGCKISVNPMDAFWGMRYGRVTDPFGHVWAFGAPLPGGKAS